ncbi:unnamed protein product [Brachionus calyciflorus]|uniref:BHLH domain-containing protein n=1 Tax=Brachionus calyciflorus TaxID=104777 RepID=A0A814DNS0_9BILA|nr:unnamed protein product [Brachionus calyciflorus]
MAQQFNYNWNVASSPYQASNINNQSYFYPVSPNMNMMPHHYSGFNMNQFLPMNGSYSTTPTSENRTFSSGYGSENNSFNSPTVAKLNYGLYPSTLQSHPSIDLNVDRTKSSKRSREDEESLSICNPDQILKEILQEPTAKKSKRVYKKKDSIKEIKVQAQSVENNDYENDFDENDFDNFDLNFSENQFELNNMDKKKRILTKNQRIAANMRERKRMHIMNDSFVKLREALPITTGRKRRKMSRLDIVCGAMEYIAYLEQLLEKEIPGEINFEAYLNSLYHL